MAAAGMVAYMDYLTKNEIHIFAKVDLMSHCSTADIRG